MKVRARRRNKWVLITVLVVLAGLAAVLAAFLGRPEKMDRYWATATLNSQGAAQISESIDYDFANNSRHGILRVVPGLDTASDVRVTSPDAPADVQAISRGGETELRIGDPNVEIENQHRYEIDYNLDTLVQGTEIAWNAYGTEWEAGADEVTAYLSAPYDLADPRCFIGAYGSQETCDVRTVEPGLLEVAVTDVSKETGVTLYATRGDDLAAAPVAPAAPTDRPAREGMSPVIPGGLALLFALGAAAVAGRLVLSAGRERVGGTGAADAAYAKDSTSYRRVDIVDLASLATTEFAPPPELSPAQGGVLLAETVKTEHQAAWLMQAAIDGYVEVEGAKKDVTLRRLDKQGYANLFLDQAFAGRESVKLGKYDPSFAGAWTGIKTELDGWQKSSGLWDPAGDKRYVRVSIFGILGAIVGVIATFGLAVAAGGGTTWALIPMAVAAAVLGASIGALTFSSELRVRTPQGSALWLRTESFRRFLEKSEAQHVDYAAEHNLLREYTAWALALGEVDHWNSAMAASSVQPDVRDTGLLYAAPYLAASAVHSSTAPSSSGGGGGGGGFSGGGGGGGGGGSW